MLYIVLRTNIYFTLRFYIPEECVNLYKLRQWAQAFITFGCQFLRHNKHAASSLPDQAFNVKEKMTICFDNCIKE